MPAKPRVALTLGEPAGIGPDIAVLLARQSMDCRLVIIGDPDLLQNRAQELALPLEVHSWQEQQSAKTCLSVLTEKLAQPVNTGQLNQANADYVLRCLNRAIDGCVSGEFDAMVTGPVHKGSINDSGKNFSGHTEYIAERTGSGLPVMMLATPRLRVALATTHVPLCKVSAMITRARIEKVVDILIHCLQHQFGIELPRIAVCGLNPHAGEGGYLGKEEDEVIIPVIQRYQQAGFSLVGPLPADSVFIESNLSRYDVVLTMYHDQGLPVIKHRGFHEAVNVTLGVPIIRTSADHGTALPMAGSGGVDISSSMAAIDLAARLARQQS